MKILLRELHFDENSHNRLELTPVRDFTIFSGALEREARLRSIMGKQIYPSQKIW